MSKIRSIEDYFVSKFNEAQEQLEELKAENDYLKEEVRKENNRDNRACILPNWLPNIVPVFIQSDIKDAPKDAWAKAVVESDDFKGEIVKIYRTKNSCK